MGLILSIRSHSLNWKMLQRGLREIQYMLIWNIAWMILFNKMAHYSFGPPLCVVGLVAQIHPSVPLSINSYFYYSYGLCYWNDPPFPCTFSMPLCLCQYFFYLRLPHLFHDGVLLSKIPVKDGLHIICKTYGKVHNMVRYMMHLQL